tara:strand:- start:306 stop:560 length:255 start_codon:yes stop_codon:yes gene_type:complete
MVIKKQYIYGKYHEVKVEAGTISEFFENLSQVPEFSHVANSQELREFFCRWFDDTLAGVSPDEEEEIFNRFLKSGLIMIINKDS